jgi:hypothetical protein
MTFLQHRSSPCRHRSFIKPRARQYATRRTSCRHSRLLVPIRFECFSSRRELATAGRALVALPTSFPGLRSKCRRCVRWSRSNQGRCASDQDHGRRSASKNKRPICIYFHTRLFVVLRIGTCDCPTYIVRYYLYCEAAFSKAFFIVVQAASMPDCICCHADSLALRISCNFE